MKRADIWTPEQIAIAFRLHAENASNERCLAVIGRTRAAVNTRLVTARAVAAQRERVKQVAEAERSLAEKMAAAGRRLSTPRSLTAAAFGDPLPGESALDIRRAAQ